MKAPKLKPYNKKLEYSYAFGVYPTLELFKYQKDRIIKVLFHSSGAQNEGVKEILKECENNAIKYEENDRAIEKIAYKENTYVIGIFEKYESILSSEYSHVVLVNPKNMGNIGTIIRTMVGLGLYDLAIIKPAADIFDPKVVRSAMGAFYQLRFHYFDKFDAYLEEYKSHNMFPFMLDGAKLINDVEFINPYSLIFGNEGQGLSPQFQEIGQPIFIPQAGDIDSLNLSVSAGIGIWEATKG
jgi:TrmH family RNA methyltransferase